MISSDVGPESTPEQGRSSQRDASAPPDVPPPERNLPDAARRALAEAAQRRDGIDRHAREVAAQPEQGGRGGPEPVRYDDWEIAGRAVDF